MADERDPLLPHLRALRAAGLHEAADLLTQVDREQYERQAQHERQQRKAETKSSPDDGNPLLDKLQKQWTSVDGRKEGWF